MNTFELTGIIIETFPAQTFGKGFRKREFIVEYGDKYPQKISFQLVQEKCDILDAFDIGSSVTVSFNIKGRDWTDKSGQVKYFNTLEVWKIVGKKSKQVDEFDEDFETELKSPQKKTLNTKEATAISWSDDDLPF
jgi:hypothetical protein